ncbi:patatin-like phospholipase family protein [Brumimicrobium oceani]|nr:patatin-like phospholipase family protein [Brumimicrobium oceani]
MKKRKLKVIISIDGGGIRGVLPLMVLNHIDALIKQNNLGENLCSNIDLIAGTSTGAIISAGLIVKENNKNLYSVDDLLALYTLRGPQLFNLSNPSSEKSEGLRLVLKRRFKDILLSDLDINYAFVSYDKNTNLPFVFGRDNGLFSSVSLSTALAACSAVPGYFPPVKIKEFELIDGIMAAKNPAQIAFEHAKTYFPNETYLLLSFGTGQLKGDMYDEMERAVDAVDSSLKSVAENNNHLIYYRFQPEILTAKPQMDNATPKNIQALVADGETFIAKNKALFNSLIEDWKENQ